MNISSDYKANEFYRFPSVEITYFLAAVLFLELFFLCFHMISQAKKKSIIGRFMAISEVIYLCLFLASIFCTYYQQNDVIISNTVFGIEVGIFLNDIFFTATRSALFTSNKLILKRKYHKILLTYNIISLVLIPVLGAIGYLTYDKSQSLKTYIIAGITFIAYISNQITNIAVFLYVTRFLSSQISEDAIRNAELRNIKFYTFSLVLSGIISKSYLLGLNVVEGDLIFPWSQTIIDGNLLCVYFILASWAKLSRKIYYLATGKKMSGVSGASTQETQGAPSDENRRGSYDSKVHSMKVRGTAVSLESIEVETK